MSSGYLTRDEFRECFFDSSTSITPSISLFRFRLPDDRTDTGLEAGEFIVIRIATDGDALHERCYSVFSPPNSNSIEILLKEKRPKRSSFSCDYFHSLSPRDPVHIKIGGGYQYSSFDGPHLGLIIGGTAISSAYQIVKARLADERSEAPDVTMLYGAPSVFELVCRGELLELARTCDWLNVTFMIDKAPMAEDTEALQLVKSLGILVGYCDAAKMKVAKIPGPDESVLVIVCGPGGMVTFLKRFLSDNIGYDDSQTFFYM